MADQRKKKPKKTKASLILFIVELVVLVVLVGAIFGYAKINEGLRNIGTADFGNAAAGNATVGNATAGNAAAANTVTANTGNIVADSASASVEGVMLANTSATGEVVVDELIEETVEDESVKKKNSESDEKASRSGKTSSGSDKKASESDKKSSEADEKTTKKKTSENAVATGSKTLKGETVTHVGTDEDPNADADAAEENEGISRNEKMKGYTNVVLVGIDTRDVDQIDYANSDTMIIASINNDTGNVRMVSVYRDTLLNVQDDYSMSLSQGDLDEEPASYAEAEVIGETTAHEEPAYDDEYEPIDDSYDEGGYDDGGYDDGGYDDGGYDDGGYDDGGDDGYDPVDEGGYDDGGYDDGGDDGYDPVDEGGYDEGGNEGDYDDGGNDGGDDGYDPVDEGGSTGDDGNHTDDGSTGGDAGNETVEETGDNGNASAEDDVAPVEEDEADPASEEDKESKEDKEDTEDKEDNEDRNDAYIFEEPDDDVSEYADNEYYNYSETGTVATSQLGETTAAGRYDKANSAYANGSTKQLLQMLNKNMDLNIHDIIVVDFSSVAKLVDDLGGIDVWMTFEEVTHMNNYCQETSKVTGLDYTPIEPEEMPREYHLNGVQAVSYARIRYTAGNDMKRTQRQRVVIQKVVEKAKKNGLDAVQGMINDVLPMCKTSFSIAEIIKLARQAFGFDIEKTAGFPFEHIEKTVYVGSKALDAVVPVTLETNVQELHEFLFDDEDYECSATVKEYSNDISVLSGLTEASRDVAAKNSVIGESGGEADVVI